MVKKKEKKKGRRNMKCCRAFSARLSPLKRDRHVRIGTMNALPADQVPERNTGQPSRCLQQYRLQFNMSRNVQETRATPDVARRRRRIGYIYVIFSRKVRRDEYTRRSTNTWPCLHSNRASQSSARAVRVSSVCI